jgi:anion-transporting  ArsA/GET3 family ATPase
VLEYMAVERLFEVARDPRFARVILDTPPTRQALDFLEAPERITGFLDSGALRFARREWFDAEGRLKVTRLGPLGRGLAAWLDRLVGLDLLRDMVEFFRAFGPLYDGFHERATEVRRLLRGRQTGFVLVAGPGEERIADTLFFARRLRDAGHDLRLIVVNQTHPQLPIDVSGPGLSLLAWLGERDRRGLDALARLLGPGDPSVSLPLLPDTPTGLPALEALGHLLLERLPRPAAPRRK